MPKNNPAALTSKQKYYLMARWADNMPGRVYGGNSGLAFWV